MLQKTRLHWWVFPVGILEFFRFHYPSNIHSVFNVCRVINAGMEWGVKLDPHLLKVQSANAQGDPHNGSVVARGSVDSSQNVERVGSPKTLEGACCLLTRGFTHTFALARPPSPAQ